MKFDKYLKKVEDLEIVSPDNYQYLEKRVFHKGDYLLDQGAKLKYVYILVEGKVQTVHSNSNGAITLNSVSKAGDVLGMVEFLNGLPINHDAIAMTKCICLCFQVANCREHFMHDVKFLAYVARRLAFITYNGGNNAAISLNFPVENRLASYLMSVENNEVVDDNFVRVAQRIGSSYRQVQRVMKEFIEKGYIVKIKRGVYQIKDPDALEDLGQDAYYFR